MSAATDIPAEVLSEAVADAIGGRRLIAAVFLTFEFDPGFFEQEILPVLLDLPRGPTRMLKLAVLEDALAKPARNIAVYYDRNGLRESDSGGAHLDIRRIPVSARTGIFHPKNIFALVESRPDPESEEAPEQSLVVVTTSANLTRTGWWQNVEVCHVEELTRGARTRISLGLGDLLRWLGRQGPADTDHSALKEIQQFLKDVATSDHRSSDGVARPHFLAKGFGRPASSDEPPPLLALLDDVFGRDLTGMNLEVISPYLGDSPEPKALATLLEHVQPREARVLLPRDNKGNAQVSREQFDAVGSLPDVSWGKLPRELLRLGKSQDAGQRFVHAKVYRFFQRRPPREVLVIGSINLTWPAHQPGGNVETAIVVETLPDAPPEFWLAPVTAAPSEFVPPELSDEEAATHRGSPLLIRYRWDLHLAEVFWDAGSTSPELKLTVQGVPLTTVPPLTVREWQPLSPEATAQLRDRLRATSFVVVETPDQQRATVLVQEEGMAQKPSLLSDLSVEDILRYWSLLSPAQRADYLEQHRQSDPLDDGADLLSPVAKAASPDRLFSRFAGIFHAFARLEAEVVDALEDGRTRDADYRMFGKKFDSLGSLLERVRTDDTLDLVERFVIGLCATQLRDQIRTRFSEYWAANQVYAQELNEVLAQLATIEGDLVKRNDADMTRFVTWFKRAFLRRQEQVQG